jgi:hypothetical protein
MAKPEPARSRFDWAPLDTAPDQPDATKAVGDDLPKEPAVRDDSRPAPGEKRKAAKSRSKQEEQ